MIGVLGCHESIEGNKSNEENKKSFRIGKELTIVVEENELIDAEYLKGTLNSEATIDNNFRLMDDNELNKMIDYMEKHNLKLAPGKYTFNQAWRFDNGKMVTHSGEFVDVFVFLEINN